ncbi:nucleotidyltransferase family protein [Grimontia sp. NTOU-MAR1]|uniref:nucleotidyltransferase family protein n=1 Tax=Grimontia sp. NTOU-MAR1 TaxID=3111011 RepID=UPI002DB7C6E9|nr:nucleotidyltransferase family protein [Grimontia sp. NTOU-MAR1]WRW00818.1 nucleotidyltransferase family protein [Grimontia sp. NTOU-MAR1]
MQTIIEWVQGDPLRMQALYATRSLKLPQCYIAAGFVRNLVWDRLHNKETATPLNDVDVIYFKDDETDVSAHLRYELHLNTILPSLNWQVRNQAHMHLRNDDEPYMDILDAMSFWPEIETAVAIRLVNDNSLECISPFGFESLFALKITPNPKRDAAIFQQRIQSKNWLSHWPKLAVKKSFE